MTTGPMGASRVPFLDDVPKTVREAFRKRQTPRSPEQALYQDIVARAVMDACGYTGLNIPKRQDEIMREARLWFKFGGEDRSMIFELAGLEEERIRQAIIAIAPKYSDGRTEDAYDNG